MKPRTSQSRRPPRSPAAVGQRWTFSVYVTDSSPRSLNALQNLTALCETHFPGRYTIEVVDLLKVPERARADSIVAVPTVVRTAPVPVRRVIGDLSDVARTTAGLQLSV